MPDPLSTPPASQAEGAAVIAQEANSTQRKTGGSNGGLIAGIVVAGKLKDICDS